MSLILLVLVNFAAALSSPARPTHHPASGTNGDHLAAADSTGPVQPPSSASSPPNSWLYKFPPWFLPSNPAPEGFLPRLGGSHSQADEFLVDDGDVILVDDEGDRQGRLTKVRVPGSSAYRDQVVQTVLNAKRNGLQTSSPSSGSVTPWLAHHNAPQPPPPLPPPTAPVTHDNPVTGQPDLHKQGVSLTLVSPVSSAVISPSNGIFHSNNVKIQSSTSNPHGGDFQPSPARPLHFPEAQNTADNTLFRPSKLLSVTHLNQHVHHSNLGKDLQEQYQNNNLQDNSVNNIIFLKNQQAALLKGSDKPPVRPHDQASTLQHRPDDHNWIPFLPGSPLAILMKQRLDELQSERLRLSQIKQKRVRLEHDRGGAGGFPTSIQDIINSDHTTVLQAHPRGRDHHLSFTTHGDEVRVSRQETNKWAWPTL